VTLNPPSSKCNSTSVPRLRTSSSTKARGSRMARELPHWETLVCVRAASLPVYLNHTHERQKGKYRTLAAAASEELFYSSADLHQTDVNYWTLCSYKYSAHVYCRKHDSIHSHESRQEVGC
jgi:hypothetical protein